MTGVKMGDFALLHSVQFSEAERHKSRVRMDWSWRKKPSYLSENIHQYSHLRKISAKPVQNQEWLSSD